MLNFFYLFKNYGSNLDSLFFFIRKETHNFREKPLEQPAPKRSNWKAEQEDRGNAFDHNKEGEAEY